MTKHERIFISRSIDEKNPSYCDEVLVSFDGITFTQYATFQEKTQCMAPGNGAGYFYDKFEDIENKLVLSHVTHWLEERTNVIVGAPEELNELIKAYEDYIELFIAENNELMGLAFVHGWKSGRVEQGKSAREKIALLKQITHG